MKIKLEKNTYLESDQWQYILRKYSRKRDEKTGEMKESVLNSTYHPTVQTAIKKIFREKVRESTATNMKDLLNEIERIENKIDDMCGELRNSEVLRDRG